MRSLSRFLSQGLIALSATLALGLAHAQPAPPNPPSKPTGTGGQEPPHRGPPPESLAACKALASGAACAFTSPRGTEKGTCFAPQGKPLACRPAHGPQGAGGPGAAGQPGTPPPKAK